MCGIFIAVRREGFFSEDDLQGFRKATDTVVHRGPDSGGSMTFKTGHGEGANLFLGHRRLSIIDLDEEANQPFSKEGLDMAYNGEVFNYLELKKNELSATRFSTTSDTEVVLEAYRAYGKNCFSMFNGMWALAIYDSPEQKLILSRDRFSIKPLYYAQVGDTWVFASEIKQFRNIHGLQLTPNTQVLSTFLRQALLDHSDETFFNEIKKFPAGHSLEIDLKAGDWKWDEYWKYNSAHEPEVDPSTSFRELLIDSLKLRLRSDVPVGTLLSGGLDSSAITALIHDHINPEIKTFSVVSDSKEYSEESFVDILINEKGIANQKLRFSSGLALENVEKVLSVQDEPYGSLSVVAQHQLFRQIKSETGITVLLSGQGADEILLGYGKFFFFYLKMQLKKGRLGSFSKSALNSWLKSTTIKDFSLSEAKRYLPGSNKKGLDFLLDQSPAVPIWHFDHMRSRQILDIQNYSVPALTHYEDRNSMDSSIEVRLPFLDYRLVNYLVNLPVENKLKDGWTKFILRDSVHELPDRIRWRKDKKGFVTPEELWMKNELGDVISSMFTGKSYLQNLGLIDNQKFLDAMNSFRSGSKWVSHGDLFRVFIAEKWLSSF
ncbi:MAG: asparagine synthase (glutamine-hydrolyzing) [Flavobacteriales bacterium]|nr:asparagine synthase (glutamine-hydrolyzing) [Flavobacteriales bacterium]